MAFLRGLFGSEAESDDDIKKHSDDNAEKSEDALKESQSTRSALNQIRAVERIANEQNQP